MPVAVFQYERHFARLARQVLFNICSGKASRSVEKQKSTFIPRDESTRVTTQIQNNPLMWFISSVIGNEITRQVLLYSNLSKIEDLFNTRVCQTLTVIDSLKEWLLTFLFYFFTCLFRFFV
jgi:predicted YcjX-like family ATPase